MQLHAESYGIAVAQRCRTEFKRITFELACYGITFLMHLNLKPLLLIAVFSINAGVIYVFKLPKQIFGRA